MANAGRDVKPRPNGQARTGWDQVLAFLSSYDVKRPPLGRSSFFGQDTADWEVIMAASAVATLPTLVLFLPLQRRLASGLFAGPVKQ